MDDLTRGMGPEAVIYSGGVGEDITFERRRFRGFGQDHIFDPPQSLHVRSLSPTRAVFFYLSPWV